MPALRALLVAGAILAVSGMVPGCATHDVVAPDAPLGRVIIYRNGVAYFERKAVVEGELTLDVPRDRVDDFLKSLTVVDAATGTSLPLSYPTTRSSSGDRIRMTIALPPGRREVRIAYVTESPAWKPSYRVVLDDDGGARLQSWAIVDNVSGEAWNRVQVGVGTTSALSFRYDLHSVQMVEREAIDGSTKLAHAPPEGGSPYSVDGVTLRVLADLDANQIQDADSPKSATMTLAGTTSAESKYVVEGTSITREFRNAPAGTRHGRDFSATVESNTPPKPPSMGIATVSAELAANDLRVRVEGYALPDDTDRASAALRRANTVRESIVARGIAPDRIEVVGHETLAPADHKVVRVVAVDEEATPVQARVEDDDGTPQGSAHFLAHGPMTIEAGHSAMVTLFDEPTAAQRVYLYDPVSSRGSKRFAFNAVRIHNPSAHTLDSGPITVYSEKRFLGEGLTEPIPPSTSAIVPFGLDRSIVVDPQVDTREEIESLRKIERGIATTQAQRIRRTRLEIANRGPADASIFIRHHVPSGWTLKDPPEGVQRMRGDTLVPVTVRAGAAIRIALEESMPLTTTVDLRSAGGQQAIEVYLRKGSIDGELKKDLEAIVTAQRELRDVEDKLASRSELLQGLRERVSELTDQLVALRRVGRAQSLSGDLAKRARQLGTRLDDVAAEITDLETQRLERSIEVSTLVADLSLPRAP